MTECTRTAALALLIALWIALPVRVLAESGHDAPKVETGHGTEKTPEATPEGETESAAPTIDRAQLYTDARAAVELEARKAALLELERDVQAKLDELKKLREEAEAALAAAKREHAVEIGNLVALYQSMKPKNAARLIEQLPLPMASEVVASMKARAAAKILDEMASERAVSISRKMTEKR